MKPGGKPRRRTGRIVIWLLKRLVVMMAGLMFFYGAGSALGASQFKASATLQASGRVVISWQDDGTQATGGLAVSITGSEGFSQEVNFCTGQSTDSGQVTDPNGQTGTTYTVIRRSHSGPS